MIDDDGYPVPETDPELLRLAEQVQTCNKHGVSYQHTCWFCEVERRHSLFKTDVSQRKRDRFELAMAAMQGLIGSASDYEYSGTIIATYAVSYADTLLAELDKEVGE